MATLRRSVGLAEATVYGVGLIVGAGIYAILGEAVARTGGSVVLSFLVAAVIATLTGLSYAELASRYPKGEGEYLYVLTAFENKPLAELTALLRLLTGVISAAAVALAFAGYLSAFVPVPLVATGILLIGILSIVNFWGIDLSVGVTMLFTAIEIFGLLLVIWLGIGSWEQVDVSHMTEGVPGVFSAAFLVFFAYVGFEALVNITEEMERPSEIVPRAIGLAVLISTVVYALVAVSALGLVDWQVLATSNSPLAEVARAGLGPSAFLLVSAIALFATSNTVLILLVSTSRLLYGVSKTEYRSFPSVFTRVHGTRQTPYLAVALVAVVAVPFVLLRDLGLVAELANVAILLVFVAVNASLLKLRYRPDEASGGFRAPLNVGEFSLTALGGLVTSAGMVLFYLIQNL